MKHLLKLQHLPSDPTYSGNHIVKWGGGGERLKHTFCNIDN